MAAITADASLAFKDFSSREIVHSDRFFPTFCRSSSKATVTTFRLGKSSQE
jgi:hypothetical protein